MRWRSFLASFVLRQALLGWGQLDGARILRRESVEEMFRNQIGDLDLTALPEVHPDLSAAVDLGPGQKWGLGFHLNPEGSPGRRQAGSGAWAGLFNSYFWVDHASGLTGSIFMQYLPFFDANAVRLYGDFEAALYAG